MLWTIWKTVGRHALCGAALLTVANLVQAQAPTIGLPTLPIPAVQDAPKSRLAQEPIAPGLAAPSGSTIAAPTLAAPANNEDKARIERLERQVQELLNERRSTPAQAPVSTEAAQGSLSTQDVQKIIGGYFADKEAQAKATAQAKAAEGYKVGTDLRMNASWQNGVVIETPNKDFWVRAGFRFQYDVDFFHQSTISKNAPPSGVGTLVDGAYFRRLRPNFSGGFWEIGEFNVELLLEKISNGTSGLDEVWVGVKNIPGIGTIRVGHFHLPHGLEADMYSGSKPSTFFEVYSGNRAFLDNQGSGILLTNSFFKDRMTYAASMFRPDNPTTANGDDFANGDYGYIGRITGLPLYENDGRCLMHLGASATWKHAKGTASFGTTPQLFDFVGGDNGFGTGTPQVAAPILAGAPGNNNKWVNTGNIAASSTSVYGAEFLYINGPLSLQAEYDWAFLNGTAKGDIGFSGGYVMASYFLTGENRTYDKRLGKLGSEYITRANTPFWFVRDEGGRFNYGLGAWELAARYSRLDLNSSTIRGGILDQAELGVNWHLNNNLRVQFMYIHTQRYDLPANASSAWMNGFGMRTQFTF